MTAIQTSNTTRLSYSPKMFHSRLVRFVRLFIFGYRCRILRPLVRWILDRFDGGYMFSPVWREIFRHHEGVELGSYSRGIGLYPGTLPRGTVVGNFSCLARGLIVLRRNHTIKRFSQHPLFFNKILGLVPMDTIASVDENPLRVGSDVWIGMNVTICPGCQVIGDGAIIGAQAVVTKDVAPFTIVAGNPARIIGKRYTPEIEAVVATSRWWDYPIQYILHNLALFTSDINEERLGEFSRAFPPLTPLSSKQDP